MAGSADIDNLITSDDSLLRDANKNKALLQNPKSPLLNNINKIRRDSEEKISKKLSNLRREFQKIKEEV